jgi:hypothetical protein
VPESLLLKDRKCGRDAIEHTFDIHVDHLLPVIDAQLIEERDGRNARVVNACN